MTRTLLNSLTIDECEEEAQREAHNEEINSIIENRFEVYEPLTLDTLGKYQTNDNCDMVTVNGKNYPCASCLSPDVPDDMCFRVVIGGKNYYFG